MTITELLDLVDDPIVDHFVFAPKGNRVHLPSGTYKPWGSRDRKPAAERSLCATASGCRPHAHPMRLCALCFDCAPWFKAVEHEEIVQ